MYWVLTICRCVQKEGQHDAWWSGDRGGKICLWWCKFFIHVHVSTKVGAFAIIYWPGQNPGMNFSLHRFDVSVTICNEQSEHSQRCTHPLDCFDIFHLISGRFSSLLKGWLHKVGSLRATKAEECLWFTYPKIENMPMIAYYKAKMKQMVF